MQLFYNSDLNENDQYFTFDKNESRHIINVLRKTVGDKVNITNGYGWLFNSEIEIAESKRCKVKILEKTKKDQRNYKLHLAVAPTKMNDRYEWFLEKATEIGVTSITPLLCENSERTKIKADRYARVIQSALKQSNQVYLPILNELISFKEFVTNSYKGDKYIAHCEDTDKQHLKSYLKPNREILIMIGPEGDYSKNEIRIAENNGFIPISLGNSRLRTETAAIVACYSVAFINES